jgi:hypothetical protein
MVLINYAGREINAKIVYYGPGLSGKTTNLECIYASVPAQSRGKMVSMKTRQDRTLFFDFLPHELGEVHGFRTRFLLYTVPGQVFYNATRKLVLKGADAVVFVADSGIGKMDDNQESLRNLEENLREQGLLIEQMPFVLQYNKRDLPQVYSVEEMDAGLNPRGVPRFEAAAARGQGVYETLHAVSRLLFQRLMSDLRPAAGRTAGGAGAPAPTASAPTGPLPARSGAGPVRASAPAGMSPAFRPAAPPAPLQASPPPTRSAPRPAPETLGPARPAEASAHPRLERPSALGVEERPQRAPSHAAAEPLALEVDPDTVLPQELFAADGFAAPADSPEPTLEEASEPVYDGYGHVVDLEVGSGAGLAAPARGDDTAFIKDPLRRSDRPPALGPRPAAPSGPVLTKPVVIVVSREELKQAGSIRILLDVKVGP